MKCEMQSWEYLKLKKEPGAHHYLRWSRTLQWLEQFDIRGDCLDVGQRSQFTSIINERFNVNCDATEDFCDDLDYITQLNDYDKHWDCIFCFEVIEHLMNPLGFLEWLLLHLKPDGSIYLSTPTRKPAFLRNKEQHFHEFHRNELDMLFDKAGLKVTHHKIINTIPWYWCFRGIRPIIRFIYFNRSLLIRLKPA